QDPTVATGAGHHSVINVPGSGQWYIVYHRRPLGETDRNHRVVSIDELHFDDRGFILPVQITKEGVTADVGSGIALGVGASGPSPSPKPRLGAESQALLQFFVGDLET